ncbi:MAG: CHAT domain-containing protein [Gloeomargaritaceae cyanobacterium C42_A2020_066]|nr:CHAT domain-containing protein [Gloeomargaritaceae cyanobacterium C42_A2020_066]
MAGQRHLLHRAIQSLPGLVVGLLVLAGTGAPARAAEDGAVTLIERARSAQERGEWFKTEDLIGQALARIAPGDRVNLAQALMVQGRLLWVQGKFEVGLPVLERATVLYQQLGDQQGELQALMGQALMLRGLGLNQRALRILRREEERVAGQPNSLAKVRFLQELGNSFRLTGDRKRAQATLQSALAVAKSLPEVPGETLASVWVALGNTAHAQGQITEALQFYAAAAEADPTGRPGLSAQLNQLRLLASAPQLSAVQQALRQTLVTTLPQRLAQLPPGRPAVEARLNFARSLQRLPRTEVSGATVVSQFAQAVDEARALGDRRTLSYGLGYWGNLYEAGRQWEVARQLTAEALQVAQQLQASELVYEWQWQMGRLYAAQGQMDLAKQAYRAAYGLSQSLQRDLVNLNPDAQFSYRTSIEPMYRQWVSLLLQAPTPDQAALVEARQVIETLQVAELNDYLQEACLDNTLNLDQVVDTSAPDTAVIYPIILPDRLEVILKLPGNSTLRHYRSAITQNDLEAELSAFRRSIVDRRTFETNYLPRARRIYDWVVGPAGRALQQADVKTLVFVLDGALRQIPMAALYDGQQYLVQSYNIVLNLGLEVTPSTPLARQELRSLLGGLSESREGFSPLASVPTELKAIQSIVPTASKFVDPDFTQTNLAQALAQRPPSVIHLATHGEFSSDPEDTFLLTWDGRITGNQLGQLLQQGGGRPELLVLSACRTAVGDDRATLGLAGVAVRAGARSTVASLWYVDDELSSRLMIEFYRQLTQASGSRAAALRQAQLQLLSDPNNRKSDQQQYAHPITWAAFVLVGNWQ